MRPPPHTRPPTFAAALGLSLLLFGLGGCEGAPSPGGDSDVGAAVAPLEILDDGGGTILLGTPPRRIVSLVPSATEILVALGQTEHLVGRTDFDTAAGLAAIPSVGGGLQPSIERIVALDPDLVIRFRAESDPDTPRELDAAGIPHLAIRPDGIDDIHRIIGLLAAAVDRAEVGDSIRAELTRELDEVARRVEGQPRPQVVFLLGGDPPLVVGGGTFLHELLELAGGTNLFADTGALYAPMSVEEVLYRNPQMILALEGGQIPAALRGLPIHRIPSQIPGLEVGEAARLLAGILHPEPMR